MNFKELFPLKVVINLDERKDRYEICVEEEFPKLDINPIRKSGVRFNFTDNKNWNGAIGCMVSHYNVLTASVLLNSNVFIFEDDIHFIGDNIAETLDKACNELNGMEWDMVYVAGNILKPFHRVSEHLAKLFHCQSTAGYGVNKNFAEKLLKYIDLQHIQNPIDWIYAEQVIPNNNAFITVPLLGIQRDDFSNIENTDVKYSEYLERRYWANFREE
jgi:GR25 family glycosyltransferase involved in LPS biosynthesis